MIYLSAQPDKYYFLWQLRLQLFNFSSLEIPREQIHVLIGFDPEKGLHPHFQPFVESNLYAQVFVYPDRRVDKRYEASIVQHLIAQHLTVYPELEKETLFVHDSDMVFRTLPDINTLLFDDQWYASYSGWYMGGNYIVNNGGMKTFLEMCEIVGIAPNLVLGEESFAGGAQYLLKHTTAAFWAKAERDGNALNALLKSQSNKQGIYNPDLPDSGVNPWYGSMWSVWWNALLVGKRLHTDSRLNFCWADDPEAAWEACSILHYSCKNATVRKGDPYFRKMTYVYTPPFYANLSHIDPCSCSGKLVGIIKQYNCDNASRRTLLPQITFLLCCDVDTSSDRDIETVARYLDNSFKTRIHRIKLTTSDSIKRDQLLSDIIQSVQTPYICIGNASVLLSSQNIMEIVSMLSMYGIIRLIGETLRLDPVSRLFFSQLLDIDYLTENRGKYALSTQSAELSSLFFRAEQWVKADCNLHRLIDSTTHDYHCEQFIL